MINIRPVSDLRNRYAEIESIVINGNQPVYLTKNGYGSMVLLSLQQYADLTDTVENKLDEADRAAELVSERYTHDEVFSAVRSRLNAGRKV